MEQLSNKLLPPQQVPRLISLPGIGWEKIGHLNVHSYKAKMEDVTSDKSIAHTNIMCFTETFLTPSQTVSMLTLNSEPSVVHRADRVVSNSQNLLKGEVVILCAASLDPRPVDVQDPPTLEITSILANVYVTNLFATAEPV